jgi:hypothetical protein
MNAMHFVGLTLVALAVTVAAAASPQTGVTGDKGGDHAAHFLACAKACADCALQCDSCHHHCAHLVIGGSKDHAKSMELCVDCGEACRFAAALTARNSRLSVPACDCCAKCCDDCAEACESFKSDRHMSECAKACRDCAKACRDMIKMVKA